MFRRLTRMVIFFRKSAPNRSRRQGQPTGPVQAYNFRMCFSGGTDRIAFRKPDHYDPHRYALLAKLIEARTRAEG